jgi:hypothetical protein
VNPPGFLALGGGGKLTFLDPWSSKTTLVATGASVPQFTDDQSTGTAKIWTIEAGQLVARSYAFEELARYGKNVTEFAHTTDSVTRVAFVDDSELFVVTDELKAPERVATDACQVSFPSGWGGFGLSFLSPCADRRLVLYGSRHRSDPGPGKSDETLVVGGPVVGNPAVSFDGDTALAFFVKNDEPGAKNGALYGGALGKAAEHIGDTPQLSRTHAPVVSHKGSAWNVLVDVGNGVGRLVQWKPGATAKELARDVEEVSGSLAIVNFDGTVGDLARISADQPVTVLARKVPPGGFDTDTDIGTAVVTDFDGTTGTLEIAPPDDDTRFEAVATGVRASGFQFIQSLNGVGYLRDFDASRGVGTLGVRVVTTGDTFDADVRASEWREVGWPEPGLLYVVPDGNSAGIWFARLK